MTPAETKPRIFFDVTDLMWVMVNAGHPTGIPRVVGDCLVEMLESAPNVIPVFFSRISRTFCRVDGRRLLARDVGYLNRLNPDSKDYVRRLYAYFGLLRRARVVPDEQDTILLLGGGWGHARRHAYLFGPNAPPCRIVWFCHDLIPILHLEFMKDAEGFTGSFRIWLDAALGQGHEFICSSRYVEADLLNYAALQNLPVRISVVPLAHEFKALDGPVRESVARLAGGETVLCVSSIAQRKNQIALVRAWERLHGEFGERLPTLVLAGDLIDPAALNGFLQQTGNPGGKVAFLGPVTDPELTQLYERCTFTVFPSLSEGWGLPVGESLWMGKPCLSSSLTSLPEVGGNHAVYFDPRDEDEMLAVLRRALRGEFAALPPPRERLRSWRQVADDIIKVV